MRYLRFNSFIHSFSHSVIYYLSGNWRLSLFCIPYNQTLDGWDCGGTFCASRFFVWVMRRYFPRVCSSSSSTVNNSCGHIMVIFFGFPLPSPPPLTYPVPGNTTTAESINVATLNGKSRQSYVSAQFATTGSHFVKQRWPKNTSV